MIRFLALLVLVALPFVASALTINRLNGSAGLIYIDFSIPGNPPLELIRSYNSITATNESSGWLGAFGWGWTTPLETILTTTPERHVVLRDGLTGNTVFFKPEKEDPKVREAFFNEIKSAYFEKKLGRTIKPSELAKLKLPDPLLQKLKAEPRFRFEMANRYNLKGRIPSGDVLISSEYGFQTMEFKNNQWVREKDNIIQIFDKDGKLVKQEDHSGRSLDFRYQTGGRGQLAEIVTSDKTLWMKFTWMGDRVSEILDNRGRRSTYSYDGSGNLTKVVDSTGETYLYKYTNKKFPHLISRVEYPSQGRRGESPYREVEYDANGLAILDRDKDGSISEYSYGKFQDDAENHFWTRVTRKWTVFDSQGKAVHRSADDYDEYQIKFRPDGSKYLYKQDSKRGSNKIATVYSMCCGKPLQVTTNGDVVNYKYDAEGLLAERSSPKEKVVLEYHPKWKKVSRVRLNGQEYVYEYDNKGSLTSGRTRKQVVNLRYDREGRIETIAQERGREFSFKYGQLNKPNLIAEKGDGTIKVEYDSLGRIRSTSILAARGKARVPAAKSQQVVQRIMSGFQELLNVFRPAGLALTGG